MEAESIQTVSDEDISSCYLDTSLITTAITAGIEHHQAAREFCERLVRDGCTVYFSAELLRLEYANFLRTVVPRLDPAVQRTYGLHRWHKRGVRRNWITVGIAELERFIGQFAVVRELQLTRDLVDDASMLMIECNLNSSDAAHIATALATGANDIAAVDGHFSRAARLLRVHIIRDTTPDR